MGEIFKQAVLPVLVVGMALLLRGDDREEAKAEAQAEVTAFSAGDQRCLRSIEPWFTLCFSDAYREGTRRTPGGLDSDAFDECTNQHLPEDPFQERAAG